MDREEESMKDLHFDVPLCEDLFLHLLKKGKMEVSITFSKTALRETCYQAL